MSVIQDILSVCAMIGLALLIVAKGDKQFIHVLEGKLFRAGKSQKMAAESYRRHTSNFSVFLFAIGFAVLSVAVILFARQNSLFPLPASIGFVMLACGIWGRIRSFVAADRELS